MNRRSNKRLDDIKISSGTVIPGNSYKRFLPVDIEQLSDLHLKGTFSECCFQDLYVERLNGFEVRFENCIFINCRFQDGTLESSVFSDCEFKSVHIKDVNLSKAEFQKAIFRDSQLQDIKNADRIVLRKLNADRKTKFLIPDLRKEIIDKHSIQIIKRNQRRHDLRDNDSSLGLTKAFSKLFFLVSDYGTSTSRVVTITFAMIMVYQRIYLLPYYFNWEPLIKNLGGSSTPDPLALVEIRAMYFTILTTAGVSFGDLVPMPSAGAYLIVTSQIIASYILLAAVIFRLAGFFQD